MSPCLVWFKQFFNTLPQNQQFDQPVMKKTCRLLFLILFSLSNVAHAYNHETDSLLEKLRYTIEDSTQIKLLVKLSSQSQLSADSLVMFAKRATAVAEKLKSDEWIVTAQVALCKWYIGHAQPDSAIALCSMLYERMEKKKYIKGMAQACRYIGKAYLFNAVDSAIQYNLKSMKLFKMAGDFFLYNSVKINLAVCYAQSDRLAEGIELTKQSFDYFERTGSVADLIAPSFNIGIFYRELGQLDSAIVYIRKNAYYHSLSGDPVETAISKNSIGDVLVLQKKFDEALEIFMGSIASGKKLNSTQLLDYGYMGLVRIAQNKKKWDDVVRFMQLVYDNSDKSLNERSILFENLYQAYKEKKDFSNAFKYYALFVAANDSFHGNERKQKLDEIEAKYQNKEKQSQIELLNKEKQLQIAEIEKQHLIRNTIVIALVILFGAGVLFFNSFKLKKKIESQQALLNERKRIGSELHDDLGAQLSTARMLLRASLIT